ISSIAGSFSRSLGSGRCRHPSMRRPILSTGCLGSIFTTKQRVMSCQQLARVKTISARDAERGETDQTDTSVEVPESEIKRLRSNDSTNGEGPSAFLAQFSGGFTRG